MWVNCKVYNNKCSPIELKFGDSIQPQLQPVGRQAILDVHLQ